MASNKAKKHVTIHFQKEQPPVCGKAVPTYADDVGNIEWGAHFQSLAKPQFNTVLRQKQDIKKIEQLKSHRYSTNVDLTPRTKNAILPKINQHLNFDVGRPVFKNLMPINVNDSLLLPKERTSIRKKYTGVKSTKPPAPDLADFLEPIKPLTHVIPLPDISIEFPKYKPDPMKIFENFIDDSLLENSITNTGLK